MILGYTIALVLLMAVGANGRLRNAFNLQLKYALVLLVLYSAQAVLRLSVGHRDGGEQTLLFWCLVMAIVVAVTHANRDVVGMPLVILGLMLNLLVVAANGGMPVVSRFIGSDRPVGGFYLEASHGTHLVWLADILPDPTGRGLLSLGDLLLMLGMACVVACSMIKAPHTPDGKSTARAVS